MGGEGVDGVGEAATLADLLKQPAAHALTEGGGQQSEGVATLVVTRDPGGAENEMGLLAGAPRHPDAVTRVGATRAATRCVGQRRGRLTGQAPGPGDRREDVVVVDGAAHCDDGGRRLIAAAVVVGNLRLGE